MGTSFRHHTQSFNCIRLTPFKILKCSVLKTKILECVCSYSSTPAGRRYQQLQHQVESLQDDLYRMETQKDDFRIKVELQEKELLELQQKVQYCLV